MSGGLRVEDSGDSVYWKAIFAAPTAEVRNATVTVLLPAQLDGRVQRIESFGAPASIDQIDGRTVEFTSRAAVPPNDELEVRVTFTHGVLDIAVPAWQQDNQRWVDLANLAWPLLVVGIVAAIALVIGTWKWRRPRIRRDGGITAPPSGLPAPAVSLLDSDEVSGETFASMLVEMFQKGVLKFDLGARAGESDRIVAGHRPEHPWEERLTASMPPAVDLAKWTLREHKNDLGDDLGDDLVRRRLFSENPIAAKRQSRRVRGALKLVSILAFWAITWGLSLGLFQPDSADTFALAAGAAAMVSFWGAILGHWVIFWLLGVHHFGRSKPTDLGRVEIARWAAFSRLLRRTGRRSRPVSAGFESVLPYAVAFGLDRSWIDRDENKGQPLPA